MSSSSHIHLTTIFCHTLNERPVLSFAHASSLFMVLFIHLFNDTVSTAKVMKPMRNDRVIMNS